MASGSFNQIYVQCPFYKSDAMKRINCEGLIDKSNISLGFLIFKDYEIQLRTFCCDHYEKCEIYRMLLKKYEEE